MSALLRAGEVRIELKRPPSARIFLISMQAGVILANLPFIRWSAGLRDSIQSFLPFLTPTLTILILLMERWLVRRWAIRVKRVEIGDTSASWMPEPESVSAPLAKPPSELN